MGGQIGMEMGQGGSGPEVGQDLQDLCMLHPKVLPWIDPQKRLMWTCANSISGAGQSSPTADAGVDASSGARRKMSPYPKETSISQRSPAGCIGVQGFRLDWAVRK